MPQLMPLNWIFSVLMMLIVVMSASVIYSEKMGVMNMDNEEKGMNKLSELWSW